MEIEIISERDNVFLARLELKFKIKYEGAVPSRKSVRDALLRILSNASADRLIIDNIQPMFGKQEAVGYAKLYKQVEAIKKIEPRHILTKNEWIRASSGGSSTTK